MSDLEGRRVTSMDLYRDYGRTYVPFRLVPAGPDRTRCSLGGAPPLGVVPPRTLPETRYFATLGLEPGLDLSLFTSFDYEPGEGPCSFFAHGRELLDESSPLVQCVVHRSEPRLAVGSSLTSPFHVLTFIFGSPGLDPVCDEAALTTMAMEGDQKTGGCPDYNQLEGEIGETLVLLRDGWVHLLQLLMPTVDIGGSWYFGEDVFHVFAKRVGNRYSFRCIWG